MEFDVAILPDAYCHREGCERVAQAKWTGYCRNHHREYLAGLAREGAKPCSRCGVEKPLSDFGVRTNRKAFNGGQTFKPECRECERAKAAEWRQRNPDYGKRWYEANKEKHASYARYQKYGILPDHLAKMVADQAGLCAICEQPFDVPNVDHDHATGAVREILCRTCNSALGLFREDPKIMLAAIRYLDKHAR